MVAGRSSDQLLPKKLGLKGRVATNAARGAARTSSAQRAMASSASASRAAAERDFGSETGEAAAFDDARAGQAEIFVDRGDLLRRPPKRGCLGYQSILVKTQPRFALRSKPDPGMAITLSKQMRWRTATSKPPATSSMRLMPGRL
jgi:hypothetical protein